MTAQSNAAAERSAHVVRGQVEAVETQPPMVQLPDGSWKLRVLVAVEAQRDAALAEVAAMAALKDAAMAVAASRLESMQQLSAMLEVKDAEVAALVEAARREEREACARWHDEQARMLRDPTMHTLPAMPGALICKDRASVHEGAAAAIRARGEKESNDAA